MLGLVFLFLNLAILLLKIFVKLTVLVSWFGVVALVLLVWLTVIIIEACACRPLSPFPPNVSRMTNQVMRWVLSAQRHDRHDRPDSRNFLSHARHRLPLVDTNLTVGELRPPGRAPTLHAWPSL